MEAWIAAAVAGAGLGLAFYACVRLRMHLGPRIRARFGNHARRAYWLITMAVMILIANLTLLGLRKWRAESLNIGEHLPSELLFLALAVSIAFGLISLRINRNHK